MSAAVCGGNGGMASMMCRCGIMCCVMSNYDRTLLSP